MDLTRLRSALNLSDEATDEEVLEAAAERAETQPAPDAPEPDPPVQPQPAPAPDPNAPAPAPDPNAPDTVVVDSATWQQVQAQAKQGADAQATLRAQERDRYLNQAVRDGKFPPARLNHWQRYYDADPTGAKAAVDALEPGLVPVTGPIGDMGVTDKADEALAEWESQAFPSVANARAARGG